jgi:hypothetical protein
MQINKKTMNKNRQFNKKEILTSLGTPEYKTKIILHELEVAHQKSTCEVCVRNSHVPRHTCLQIPAMFFSYIAGPSYP